jgi:hypothetical protein
MKNPLMIVLCSTAILVSGCTSPNHSRTINVASLPGDLSNKVLSQITHALGDAGISCDITLGSFGSEPARYDIHVPADKQAEATNLLKQDAVIHKYELKVY